MTDDSNGSPMQPNAHSRRPSITRSLWHSLVGVGGARVLGAISGVLIARLLGPSLRGEFGIALIIATCASMLATCGLQFWVATTVAADSSAFHVTRTLLRHILGLTLIIAAIAVVTTPTLATQFGFDQQTVIWIAAYAATNATLLLVVAVPNGDRAMRTVAAALTAGALVTVGGVLALLLSDLQSVPWALATGTVGNLTSIAIAIPSWRRLHVRPAPPGAESAPWATVVKRFSGSGVGELVFLAMLRLDLVVLAFFVPMPDVGLYAVATSYAEILWIAPDAVAQVTLPLAAEPGGQAMVPRVFRLTMTVMVPTGFLMWIAAPVLIPVVFGRLYLGATTAVPFLLLASVLAAVWKVLGGAVVAMGKPSARLWSAGGGLVMMLIADVVLIPPFGIAGASAATALGYAAAAASMIISWSSRSEENSDPLWKPTRDDFSHLRQVLVKIGGRS